MKIQAAASPHICSKQNTGNIMLQVIIALLPSLGMAVVRFGFLAVRLTAICVITAVVTEAVFGKLILKKNTVGDLSAAVTGLIFALTLPVTAPTLISIICTAFAIIIVKIISGGIGKNTFNPALAGRALFMMICPAGIIRFADSAVLTSGVDAVSSSTNPDLVTMATPLHHMQMPALPEISILDMFLGNIDGSMGEISTLAILIGGLYLAFRKIISLRIPVSYLGTVAVLTFIFYKGEDPLLWMIYSLLGGGVMFGAFFMATDYATSPVTPVGQIIYGIGCGALTVLIRYFGLFPEGVTYAILLMNAAVWAIDAYTAPRRFGTKKGGTA